MRLNFMLHFNYIDDEFNLAHICQSKANETIKNDTDVLWADVLIPINLTCFKHIKGL